MDNTTNTTITMNTTNTTPIAETSRIDGKTYMRKSDPKVRNLRGTIVVEDAEEKTVIDAEETTTNDVNNNNNENDTNDVPDNILTTVVWTKGACKFPIEVSPNYTLAISDYFTHDPSTLASLRETFTFVCKQGKKILIKHDNDIDYGYLYYSQDKNGLQYTYTDRIGNYELFLLLVDHFVYMLKKC